MSSKFDSSLMSSIRAKKRQNGAMRANVRVGTSSWSDRSLTHESDWYPKRTMKAHERIEYYCQRLDLVELETTYRFPPTPDVSRQLVDRTPDGFKIDIDAWSLLSGQPTLPASLWEDLSVDLDPRHKDKRRIYDSYLSETALDECWMRFLHAVDPLRAAGRLGALIFRFPRWFSPKDETYSTLETLAVRLATAGEFHGAVEFENESWADVSQCERTFSLLEDIGLAYVCTDNAANQGQASHATTSDVGILRLSGRRVVEEWVADWRSYRYSDDELREITRQVEHLADGCKELHVLFSTCWKDDAVTNALRLKHIASDEVDAPLLLTFPD